MKKANLYDSLGMEDRKSDDESTDSRIFNRMQC